MAVIGTRFGDEQSTLLDEFERKSFEAHAAQLSRAMMGRSLSEPGFSRPEPQLISMAPIPAVVTHVMQRPHHDHGLGSGFHKVLKKLIKPILGRKKKGGKEQVPDVKDILFCNDFRRSLRF